MGQKKKIGFTDAMKHEIGRKQLAIYFNSADELTHRHLVMSSTSRSTIIIIIIIIIIVIIRNISGIAGQWWEETSESMNI